MHHSSKSNGPSASAGDSTPYPRYESPARPDPPKATHLNLSHPKNFLGVPFALRASGSFTTNVKGSLVASVGHARLGAEELGLITQSLELTPLGKTVASPSVVGTDTVAGALSCLAELKGSQRRFCHVANAWAGLAQRVYRSYEPARFLIGALVDAGAIGTTNAISLPALMCQLVQRNPEYTTAVCLEADAPPDKLTSLTRGQAESLNFSGQFRNLKNNLYHVGFLTSSGATTDALQPEHDHWAVTPVAAETITPENVDTLVTVGDGDAE